MFAKAKSTILIYEEQQVLKSEKQDRRFSRTYL